MNLNDLNPFLTRYPVRAQTRLAVPITMPRSVPCLVVERRRCSVVPSIDGVVYLMDGESGSFVDYYQDSV